MLSDKEPLDMGKNNCRQWVLLGLWCVLAGCASNPANPSDPYEKYNRSMDSFNDKLDRHILKPLADFYTQAVPRPVRQSLNNAFTNLTYADTIGNGLLQGKTKQGGSDALRMLTNSTLGIGGLFDVATKMGLVKHDEDFGLTLGHWGVKQKNYIVLPLLGPSTGRDIWAIPVTIASDPLMYISVPLEASIPLDTVRVIDFRASAENAVRFRNAAAIDPYVFTREAYLQNRQFQITSSKPASTQPSIDYFENEPDVAPATQPAMMPTTQPSPPAEPLSAP
jgi:phospholipid-binding lipoprotein MlaA